MNYVKQIRDFWRAHEEHSFSTTDIAVYFYLLEVCNICRWKNPFSRNNAKIEADLGICFNTLNNVRHRLAQADLITFETTNGSPNVLYTLSNFDEVDVEVTGKVGGRVGGRVGGKVGGGVGGKVGGGVGGGVGGRVGGRVGGEINKTKHKQNETKEREGTPPPPDEISTAELPVLPDAPTTSEGVAEKPPDEAAMVFTPPTVEEVNAYCAECKNDVDAMRFVYFYQSKGWMVGQTKMQDWKAAVRAWENRENKFNKQFNLKNHGTKPDEGSSMLRLPASPSYETKL
jgi:outer membrane lipoprotein SlyB